MKKPKNVSQLVLKDHENNEKQIYNKLIQSLEKRNISELKAVPKQFNFGDECPKQINLTDYIEYVSICKLDPIILENFMKRKFNNLNEALTELKKLLMITKKNKKNIELNRNETETMENIEE